MESQTRIPGTFDNPTPAVNDLARLYVQALYEWQRLQKEADEKRSALLEQMEADNIGAFVLDDLYEIELKLTETKKVKVKKLSQEEEE